MPKFEAKENELYIDGKKVIRAWESWSGWYWFATEKVGEQMSDFGDGRGVPDTIWYGLVQGLEEEWGYFSQAEIERLKPFSWEIPKKNYTEPVMLWIKAGYEKRMKAGTAIKQKRAPENGPRQSKF